jgi:membrane-bound lytic murein transglycosylase D
VALVSKAVLSLIHRSFFAVLILLSFNAHANLEDFECPVGFNCPAEAVAKAKFWDKLFAVYTNDQAVFYDAYNPQVTYAVVDDIEKCHMKVKGKTVLTPEARLKHNYIRGLLLSIKSKRALKKTDWTEAELKILEATSVKRDFAFSNAPNQIQCSKGLKQQFFEGLQRCSAYSDFIRETFEGRDKSPDYQYLPLSESLCSPGAKSTVGAGGYWQFMSATAKLFKLRMNTIMDERKDIFASTDAASRYLDNATTKVQNAADAKNGEPVDTTFLESMILTSYNCGPGGMCSSISKNKDLDYLSVIENHEGDGFGDAVKNYFPAYLAAYHIATHVSDYYDQEIDPSLHESTQVIELTSPTKLTKLSADFGILLEKLEYLNPKYKAAVWSGSLNVPTGYTLEIPLNVDPTKVKVYGTAIRRLDRSAKPTPIASRQSYLPLIHPLPLVFPVDRPSALPNRPIGMDSLFLRLFKPRQ